MLREIAPAVTRAAIVSNPRTVPYDYFLHGAESAGPSLGLQILPGRVENTADIERTRVGGLGPKNARRPTRPTTIATARPRFPRALRLDPFLCPDTRYRTASEHVARTGLKRSNVLASGGAGPTFTRGISIGPVPVSGPVRAVHNRCGVRRGKIMPPPGMCANDSHRRAWLRNPHSCAASGARRSCRARLAPSLSDTERCGALLLRSRSARCPHSHAHARIRAAADAIATTLRSPPRAPPSLLSAPP